MECDMAFNFDKVSSILVCPKSRCELIQDGSALVSTSPDSRLSYPILEGIPRLLVDESKQLATDVWAEIMSRVGRDPKTGKSVQAR
jgi:uncharacterized protein